ncbi:hypothetical protein [Streptomyces lavendulocolor]|uniref:hypothetical protein n=1 Tax=Streptomyces lavendulocolor TaxID=67316 RepID=UPI003C2C58C9
MSTPWQTRRATRRPFAARATAPREPVAPARIGRRVVRRRAKGMDAAAVAAALEDAPARIGRRVVRRRAKGMDAAAVAAALEDARFDARQASRHKDLADDERGRAELAEGAVRGLERDT